MKNLVFLLKGRYSWFRLGYLVRKKANDERKKRLNNLSQQLRYQNKPKT